VAEISTWLEEVSASPYAIQLAKGFRWLRFDKPLERDYRQFSQAQNQRLRSLYLYFGMAMWVLFALADQLLIHSAERWWMLLVRVLALGVLVALVRPLRQLVDERDAGWLIMFGLWVFGGGAIIVVAIAHAVDHSYPYEGLMLIIFSVYFLAGLRLGQALLLSLLLISLYTWLEIWAGYPPPLLTRNLLFLISTTIVAALGCYILEFKSREQFLNHYLMRELADHDSLTGLHNRRSFRRKLDGLWRQATREKAPLVMLLCDVDHFKAYNDRYGHQAGDLVLRALGQVLEYAARRPLDIAVRMGGEEFAVLLYGMNKDQAMSHAEAMRMALLDLAIAHDRSLTASVVSMSIGLAYVVPDESVDMSILYEQADKALYRAKDIGRNRVVQWADMQ
jgi:diguanylate cyclase (GGDEF)-like protein